MKLRTYLLPLFFIYFIILSFTQSYASDITDPTQNPTYSISLYERPNSQSINEDSDDEFLTNNPKWDEVTTPEDPRKSIRTEEFNDYLLVSTALILYIDILSYFSNQGIFIGSIPLLYFGAYFASNLFYFNPES